MSYEKISNHLKKMKNYAQTIERGHRALHNFMYEACKLIFNYKEEVKEKLKIDNDDIEKGVIEYFFPPKQYEKSDERQRRNMYIRALKKLTSAETLRDAEILLDEKGVYTLSRNDRTAGVDVNDVSDLVDDEYDAEPEELENTNLPTEKEFRTLLKQKNALKKTLIILKYDGKYIAITQEDIYRKLCSLIAKRHCNQIFLFDED